MAYSKLGICNLALSRFGQGYISDLAEDSEAARLLDLNYDPCLKESLRGFPWNFATRTQLLAASTETIPGWDYVYAYPANCVLVRRVFAEGDARNQEKTEFKEFTTGTETLIASDIEDAYAEYTYFVIDPTLYDPLFVEAFSYKLAAAIATSLANSQKGAEMLQKYQMTINNAQFIGAVENEVKPEYPSSYVTGRR